MAGSATPVKQRVEALFKALEHPEDPATSAAFYAEDAKINDYAAHKFMTKSDMLVWLPQVQHACSDIHNTIRAIYEVDKDTTVVEVTTTYKLLLDEEIFKIPFYKKGDTALAHANAVLHWDEQGLVKEQKYFVSIIPPDAGI